ncbi:MAG TPA: Isoquinoline 1-oxidoreductase subunit [Kofleriaceae bacterium]|nr:Isoquinoline 1-oxidoreductase subunit [Kofleriaceae bacterium]
MPRPWRCLALAVLAACGAKDTRTPAPPPPRVAPDQLRSVDDFASIADPAARSQALFREASRVFLHARCVNCHPDGDSPHQGMRLEAHDPPVERGPSDEGVVGMRCSTCHQDRNQALARVPGAPAWHLAPRSMAWVGRTPHQLCEQLKDPARNGDKTLAQLVEHTAHDPLVAWGWAPGADREPAPGTQAQLGALVAAWVETGAACPEEESR